MSLAIGGSGGLTLLTTQSVRATTYDPVTRANAEFDGRLFYEILPDIYSMMADYDLMPRIWEGYSEAMVDLLLSLICADSSRSLLDVTLDYQHKYQHFDFWFEHILVNDPSPEYVGRGAVNFTYYDATQVIRAEWVTKLGSDRAGWALRSSFDQRAVTRWKWEATYSKFDIGSYGMIGYYNSEASTIENCLLVGVGVGGCVAVLQIDALNNINMVQTTAVVPLNTSVSVSVTYQAVDNILEVTVTNLENNTVLLDAFSYSLLSGPSSETFEVDRFGLVNIDVTTVDFSPIPGFNPKKGQSVEAEITYLGYLDPSVRTDIQSIPALQDSWRDPTIFWEDTREYEFHDSFFAFDEQPEDYLLAEYVSYNKEMVKNSFGIPVGFSGDNTATYRSQVQALHSVYWKGPTILGIKLGTQAILGLPFSEEAGVVTTVNFNKTGDTGEIVIQGKNGKRAYEYQNSVDPVVVVGDTVAQFLPLTTGVDVVDWKSDPNWYRPFLGSSFSATTDVFSAPLHFYESSPVPVNEMQKYHMFMIRVHESLYDSDNLVPLFTFFNNIKQTWKAIVFSLLADSSDDVSVEDSVDIDLTAPIWDHGGSSLIVAPKYGAPGGPPYDFQYESPTSITYGMFYPSFPDDPLDVVLTDDGSGSTIIVNGVSKTFAPGEVYIESIP